MSKTVLSLIIPVFNEQETINTFIEAIKGPLENALSLMPQGSEAEILFINDGSSDATGHILDTLCQAHPHIKAIHFSRNFGKEAALSAGLDHVSGQAAIPMDVDLQDPPHVIVDLVKAWIEGAEVVNAHRINRDSDSWLKRVIAKAFYDTYNKVSDRPIPSDVGDFRLLSRKAIDALHKFPEKSRFNKGLFNWIGFKVATVEYVREPRSAGSTKWSFWKLWNLALDGITSSTTAPLRVWTYIGTAISGFALSFAAYIILKTLIWGIDAPGYASIMVSILFLGGLQLISLGIIGEYVGRISVETRNRPLYIISTKTGFSHDTSP